MSICAEVPWEEVVAELPSLVEEMEVGGHQVEQSSRQEILIRNRMLEEKAMKELTKNNPPPRDDDDETEDGVYDEEEADIREMRMYRRGWEHCKARHYGSFEDNTTFRPMRYTEGTIPKDARCEHALEIFSVQVTETKDGLEWPLHVYGHIAVRDTVDQNRNLLFNRKRDNCQILTPKDSFLLLAGPSRPVMVIDPVTFEVDLKVKGETEDEDKVLSLKLFVKRVDDFIVLRRCFGKRSTVEITFAVVSRAVEATVHSVKVISGSWPDHLCGLVVSRTASIIQKDIVLLDSQDGRMPITPGGKIELKECCFCATRRRAGHLCAGLTSW